MNRVVASPAVRDPWYWVPTAYFAEGGPFMAVSAVSAILFKSLGMSNAQMAFWTGLMLLPWSVKPLWAPLLDGAGSKRSWIVGCQLLMSLLFGVGALLLERTVLTALLIVLFFLLAFASATHDVAADGFYLIALDEHEQAFFSGIRATFYRLATVSVQGGLVVLAGVLEMRRGSIRQGWAAALAAAAVAMAVLTLWHWRVLPRCEGANAGRFRGADLRRAFRESWGSFLHLPGITSLIVFLFLFRIAEAQLGKIAGVFLIDTAEAGGLAMPLAFQGFLYGTVGVIALTVGGILGGVIVAHRGFRRCAWGLAAALNVPDLVYVYLAYCRPASHWVIGSCVAVEQFGYGLGYTAVMMVMIAAAANSGKFRTSHFALMTAISILAMILFGMISGWMQQRLGYPRFFVAVVLLTLPSFWAQAKILPHLPEDFGKARRRSAANG